MKYAEILKREEGQVKSLTEAQTNLNHVLRMTDGIVSGRFDGVQGLPDYPSSTEIRVMVAGILKVRRERERVETELREAGYEIVNQGLKWKDMMSKETRRFKVEITGPIPLTDGS